MFFYIRRNQILAELGFTSYSAYLNSSLWFQNRRRLYDELATRDEDCCQVCGTTLGLHLHHTSYERIGVEPVEDIVALCANHHQELHEFADWMGLAPDELTLCCYVAARRRA